jgi:hypothetical protein
MHVTYINVNRYINKGSKELTPLSDPIPPPLSPLKPNIGRGMTEFFLEFFLMKTPFKEGMISLLGLLNITDS